jgi:hypothetical protein
MRKLLRLGIATLIAIPAIAVWASTSSAAPIEVIDCDNPPVNNPGVSIPPAVPVIGGAPVLGAQDPCAELVRTLVFVGSANISNGVNFAGTGTGAAGGSFTFDGDCVMVTWEVPPGPDVSAPVDPLVTTCGFNTTSGTYGAPTNPNPIINPVGAAIEGASPGYTGLDWAPSTQASCLNSNGSGTSSFTSDGALTPAETWTASYTWTNSLNNLRGSITKGTASYGFDAKIEGHADPRAADPLDKTDAGCLQKTLNALTGSASGASTGLNTILIVGTSTWRSVVPTIL